MRRLFLAIVVLAFAIQAAQAQTDEELQDYMHWTLSSFSVDDTDATNEITWDSYLEGAVEIKLPFKLRALLSVIQEDLKAELTQELLDVIEEDGFKDALIEYDASMTFDFKKFKIVINKESWNEKA